MGAKPGRMKGNKQKAKYRKPEKKHGKPGGREGGKQENRKESLKHWNSTLRGKARKKGTEGTEGQVAGIGPEADERKRKERGKYRRRKQKVSTCGTAVGAKQGRAKGNEQKAEYRNRERMHGKPGRKERGKRKKRKQKTSTEEAAVRQKQEEKGKEETES